MSFFFNFLIFHKFEMLKLGLPNTISFNVRFFFENMPTFNSKYGIFEMLHLLHDMAQVHSLIDSHNS
jgi:hypothetical protein